MNVWLTTCVSCTVVCSSYDLVLKGFHAVVFSALNFLIFVKFNKSFEYA